MSYILFATPRTGSTVIYQLLTHYLEQKCGYAKGLYEYFAQLKDPRDILSYMGFVDWPDYVGEIDKIETSMGFGRIFAALDKKIPVDELGLITNSREQLQQWVDQEL